MFGEKTLIRISLLCRRNGFQMKFCIVGTGYVGLSLSTLISRRYPVVAVDVVAEKVEKINSGESPIVDKEISEALASKAYAFTRTNAWRWRRDSAFMQQGGNPGEERDHKKRKERHGPQPD